jgi:hypothetical protein
LDADHLSQVQLDESDVLSWNGYTTHEVGSAGPPKLRTNESRRYVRFGTADASSTKGNYLSFGTQTWNVSAGFTAVGAIRFYNTKSWQRWFDFGNGQSNQNVAWAQMDQLNSTRFHVYDPEVTNEQPLPLNQWIVVVARASASEPSTDVWIDPETSIEGNVSASSQSGASNFTNRTLTNNWIGRSNWGYDSYACLDLRETAFYDRALTDAELRTVVLYMRVKYQDAMLSPSAHVALSLVRAFVDPSAVGVINLSNMHRGLGTPLNISSQSGIPNNGDISLSQFKGCGWGTNPKDMPGLYAWYSATSWSATLNRWEDLSGNLRHVTDIRPGSSIAVGESVDPLGRSVVCLSGDTASGMRFPDGVLPAPYTLFHVARYSGVYRRRIFDGLETFAYYSGFHGGRSGVAYHGSELAGTSRHGDEWVVSCDQNFIYRSNRVQRNTAIPSGTSQTLTINYGKLVNSETSDWAVAEVIVFDRELSHLENLKIEEYLYTKHSLQPLLQFPPPAGTPAGAEWTKDANDTVVGILDNVYRKYVTTVTGQAYGNGIYKAWANSIWGYSASDGYGGNEWPPSGAFDNLPAASGNKTGWHTRNTANSIEWYASDATSTAPAILGIDMPAPIVLRSYSIQTRGDATNFYQMPSMWEVQGSLDGLAWVTVDERSSETVWTLDPREYSPATPQNAFAHYRLVIYRSNAPVGSPGYIHIGDWRLFGYQS